MHLNDSNALVLTVSLMEEEVHGMYTKLFVTPSMRAAFTAVLIFTCVTASASSFVIEFDFEDTQGEFENLAQSGRLGLTASPWFDERDSLTDFSGQPSTGRSLAARSFVAGNSLRFELNLEPGLALTLDSYQFDHTASASGPTNWNLFGDGASIGGGATGASFTRASDVLSMSGLRGTILIALVGADAASNSGTYRIDNFRLSGSVSTVPLAPSLILLSSGLALLRVRRQ